MPREPRRLPFRITAALATAAVLSGCAAVPGPYENQAASAAQACQWGNQRACYDLQALQPAVAAEQAQGQRDAQVNSALVAGLVGLAAGAAIIGASNSDRGYRGRGYDRGYNRGYYDRGYGRGWR